MKHEAMTAESFGTGRISSILIRLTPPVMIAQLIQAMYNTVDSFFVGRFSEDGLTALSVIYPLQLLITALAVGTGSGVNTLMARLYAQHEEDKANHTGGMGIVLALMMWSVLSMLSPTFFQDIGASRQSSILAITRQVFCLIPIFWLLSKIGLAYTWLAFPASEIITGAIGSAMYMKEIKSWSK